MTESVVGMQPTSSARTQLQVTQYASLFTLCFINCYISSLKTFTDSSSCAVFVDLIVYKQVHECVSTITDSATAHP